MKTFKEFMAEAKHGPKNAKERRQERDRNLSKIMQKRLKTKADIRGGVKQHYHSTDDPDDMTTVVTKYKNPAHYAVSDSPKVELKNGKKVTSTNSERYIRAKHLMKQVTKNRRNPKGTVLSVDITPNLERDYGDTENIKKRTQNLKKAVKGVPDVIKKAGGKSGDTVIGKPGQTQEGGPEEKGRRSRARLYSKLLPQASPMSPLTKRMKGKV